MCPATHRMADERGSVTMISALVVVVILGTHALLLDVLTLYGERWSLQTAVDAAAAAAGTYLPAQDQGAVDGAIATALEYALLNGLQPEDVDILFTADVTANDRVTVTAQRSVSLSFGPIAGIASSPVRATATAQVGSVSAFTGVLPWGLVASADDLRFGEISCLKLASHDTTCGGVRGSFNALDIDSLGSSSASIYRDRIVTGSTVAVAVGESIPTLTGNMRGPTEQGVGCTTSNGRISGNHSTFEEVVISGPGGQQVLDWENPRIAVVPFVTPGAPDAVTVVGFGAFFIEGCGDGGSVLGRFIRTVIPGGGWSALVQDFGARTVRLVE